jgi:hypothetical protein
MHQQERGQRRFEPLVFLLAFTSVGCSEVCVAGEGHGLCKERAPECTLGKDIVLCDGDAS